MLAKDGKRGPLAHANRPLHMTEAVRIRRRRRPEFDVRRIAALGQLDANGVAPAVGVIVLAELLAQARGLDAHDWVDDWVERLRSIEDFEREVVALEPLAAPCQRLVNEVLQEPLPAPRLLERTAAQDTGQLLANGLLVDVAPAMSEISAMLKLQRAGIAPTLA